MSSRKKLFALTNGSDKIIYGSHVPGGTDYDGSVKLFIGDVRTSGELRPLAITRIYRDRGGNTCFYTDAGTLAHRPYGFAKWAPVGANDEMMFGSGVIGDIDDLGDTVVYTARVLPEVEPSAYHPGVEHGLWHGALGLPVGCGSDNAFAGGALDEPFGDVIGLAGMMTDAVAAQIAAAVERGDITLVSNTWPFAVDGQAKE